MTPEIIHNHNVDAPAEERMRALLDTVSSYIEQYHGGWVRMVEFDGKVQDLPPVGPRQGHAER